MRQRRQGAGVVLAGALALVACDPDTPPQDPAACAEIPEVAEREECRFQALAAQIDDLDAVEAGIAQVPDPGARDLLRLRLAITRPASAGRLCRSAETEGAIEKCRQVLGRPHLSTPPRPEGVHLHSDPQP